MATLTRETVAAYGASEHLKEALALLDLQLRRQVLRLRAARLLGDDEMRGLYISDSQADALLEGSLAERGGKAVAELRAADAAVDGARAELRRHVADADRDGQRLPLQRLACTFGLGRLELEALMVAVAPSIDLRYEMLYAYAQNDVTRRRPRVDLVGRLVDAEHEPEGAAAIRAIFDADAPLVRFRLVRLIDDPQEREPPLLARVVAADERVADWILGDARVDPRLPGSPRCEGVQRGDLRERASQRAVIACATRQLYPRGGAVYLRGADDADRMSAARAVCAELGVPLLHVDMTNVSGADTPSFAELVVLGPREAALQGAALLVSAADQLLLGELAPQRLGARLIAHAAALGCPLLLEGNAPWPSPEIGSAPVAEIVCTVPTATERLELWRDAIGRSAEGGVAGPELETLAERFVLGARQIRSAVEQARTRCSVRLGAVTSPSLADLFSAARAQSGAELATLAHRLDSPYRWGDLVLPRRAMQQLLEVRAAIRHRSLVLEGWGFAARHGTARGLNILFAGPSGTGKTMAAQVLAHDAELDIYRIDLAGVVSKYIGETERNLERIFAVARSSNAVLFFDEADALFGKRTEVKDAHDRYANIEVAYLLQKMEEYDGVTILATNLRRNLDDAFARRIHHAVEFPLPETVDRERLWRAMLPPGAPIGEDLDLGFLARQFELSGGHIRNVVLAAAFLAADESAGIGMRHLMRAVARELQKLGRMPSRADFREHYDSIRDRT